MELNYLSTESAFKECKELYNVKRTYFYDLVNSGFFLCGKIGRRTIIPKSQIYDENERKRLLEKYESFGEYWECWCENHLHERYSLKEMAIILSVSYGLLYNIVKKNMDKIEVEFADNGRGNFKMSIRPKDLGKFMKDLNG